MCGDGEAGVEKGRLVLQLVGEKNQNQGKGKSTENGRKRGG